MADERPLIGISVGDPVGMGPEITDRALSLPEIYDLCRPLVVGEAQMMRNAVRFSALEQEVNPVDSLEQGKDRLGVLDVLDMKNIAAEAIPTIHP